MNDELDKLLAHLRQSQNKHAGLNHLEHDVWRKIAVRKQDEPSGRLEAVLAALFPAQHRFIPILGAALLGIALSIFTLNIERGYKSVSAPAAAEMLNFKVFKPQIDRLVKLVQVGKHI